jgi:type II secretory ATPase GspE/PulE/Tfp pilus assembly ATPase PilB-like protein
MKTSDMKDIPEQVLNPSGSLNSLSELTPPTDPDQAPAWLTHVIQWTAEHDGTDLHLFPSQDEAMLWVRIDGRLYDATRYSLSIHQRLVSRLKVMARCTDYDGELIQEGRFQPEDATDIGEARMSVIPTLHGEKAVIRLLTGGERLRMIDELGFSGHLVDSLRKAVALPQGLLLSVGPSGCGKSTALFAMLHDLNRRSGHPLSIVTIEDPVEQSLPFAAQVCIDPARGLGFAAGLRALLRQDLEIIVIGEIRDPETAETALQAALAGHRLLSTKCIP